MKIILEKGDIAENILGTFDFLLKGLLYETIQENNEKIVYEGFFSLEITAEMLETSFRSFKKFCDSISVEGGKARRRGSTLVIEPYRKKTIRIRLSHDEYKALNECAALRRKKPRAFFRAALLSSLLARRRGEF